MNYIKAKFQNSTRSYVYRTEDSVKSGDTNKCLHLNISEGGNTKC